MNTNFSEVMEKLKTEHFENLKQMPLPPGAEDFLKAKILEQDVDTITFMLKLSWVFGAQAGQQAVAQAEYLEQMQQRKPRIEA